MSSIDKQTRFAQLPAEWPTDLLPEIQTEISAGGRKVVVLDDDPTGTQTVHSLAVLTEWSVAALQAELNHPDPCVYILTNSRSMPLSTAQALNAEIAANLAEASRITGRPFAVVSRSDSTLRGHYPGETDALAAALGMAVDATLIIPFFLEGGRFTIDDVHYVAEGEMLTPAAETPFARDAAFGYHESNLRRWVEEKSGGRLPAAGVASVTLEEIRQGGPARVTERLMALGDNAVCVVNAASMRDVQVFVLGLLAAEAQGKTFLYRTAASFVQARAGIAPRPLLTAAELALPASGGGLVVVGSYVPKSTSQLGELLAQPGLASLELDVNLLLDDGVRVATIDKAAQTLDEVLGNGGDVVLYTSRTLVTGDHAEASLDIGQRISSGLVAIVQRLRSRPRYLLAKGGVTSSDLATQGLNVKRATVLGQILPGVPVWRTGPESRLPGLVYIVFPGNVGNDRALVDAVARLGSDNRTLVKQQFGAAAASYAESRVHAQGASLARLVELVAPQPTWRVLDVATGAGHTAFAFAPHVAAVVATDITPEMLATTARLAAQKGLTNLAVQEADAEALPFAEGEFDVVTCRIAPHHFGDIGRFLGECARVLKPGGVMALVDNLAPGDSADAGDYVNALEKLRDPSHHRCLRLDEWLDAFRAAGLAVEHHEIQPKAIEFNEWAMRMVSDPNTLASLRSLLLGAPPAVEAFLQPTVVGDDVHFLLAELVLIARRQS